MKIRFLCLFYILFTPVGAQEQVADHKANIVAIENTLNDFSAALSTADTVSLKCLTGSTFVLLEEGRTFDFQEMILSIQEVFAAGAKMKRVPVKLPH